MRLDLYAINKETYRQEFQKLANQYGLPEWVKTAEDVDTFLNSVDNSWFQEKAQALGIKGFTIQKGTFCDENHNITAGENLEEKINYLVSDAEHNTDAKRFHIFLGRFRSMREALAKMFNANYYYAKYNDLGPDLNSYSFMGSNQWTSNNKFDKTLCDFFMHSDCDGTFSEEQIKNLNYVFEKANIREKEKKNADITRFCDFLNQSSQKPIYWRFEG